MTAMKSCDMWEKQKQEWGQCWCHHQQHSEQLQWQQQGKTILKTTINPTWTLKIYNL